MTRDQKSCSFIEPEGSNIRGTRNSKKKVIYHHVEVDKGRAAENVESMTYHVISEYCAKSKQEAALVDIKQRRKT